MKTYEVHGPSARSRVLRFKSAAEAVVEASVRIFIGERDKPRSVDRLEAGEQVTFTYGFSEVTIYVKEGKA